MSSRCLSFVALLFVCKAADVRTLRVCADPNNLPFSNQAQQGLENRLAELLARSLHAELQYTWWSERKSFLKNSLNQHQCDVVLGVPTGIADVLTTRPYYRSTYVFVTRADRHLALSSLSGESLAQLRIGIHIAGEDFAPPAAALARRGLLANLKPYSLFGAYGETDPPAKLITAVANGEVDAALAWGPLAGYFATKQNVPLTIAPVSPASYLGVPFTYSIAAAVRSEDGNLKTEIEHALSQHCTEVRTLLQQYGVPLVTTEEDQLQCAAPPSRSPSYSR